MIFGRKQERDLIRVNYDGELPGVVQEFLSTTKNRPEILEVSPLVLSVKRDRDFIEELLSVIHKSKFRVHNVELRKQA